MVGAPPVATMTYFAVTARSSLISRTRCASSMTARERISSATGFLQVADIDAAQPLDVAGDIVAQGRPVEAHALGHPAEADRVLERLGEMGGVDEELLRHAAADDAGAADLVLLGDGDPGAVLGRRRAPRARRPSRRRSRRGRSRTVGGMGRPQRRRSSPAQNSTPCFFSSARDFSRSSSPTRSDQALHRLERSRRLPAARCRRTSVPPGSCRRR